MIEGQLVAPSKQTETCDGKFTCLTQLIQYSLESVTLELAALLKAFLLT